MYAKLFASIYQGTLRGNTHGLVVFTNLLAHADQEGWVDIHPRAIAEEVGLSIDEVKKAIEELEAPDLESRSPEEDGRRIVKMDVHRAWGWKIVNYGKYRSIRSEEDRREQNRLAQQRFREKNSKKDKQESAPVSNSKPSVSSSKQQSAESANTEAEVKESKPKYDAQAHLYSVGVPLSLIKDWFSIRKAKRLPATQTAIDEILKEITLAGITPEAAIRECCARGWAGFKAAWMDKDLKASTTDKPLSVSFI